MFEVTLWNDGKLSHFPFFTSFLSFNVKLGGLTRPYECESAGNPEEKTQRTSGAQHYRSLNHYENI